MTLALQPPPPELSLEEYRFLRQLGRVADDLLEESLRERETLSQCFQRCFPVLLQHLGARAIAVTTRDEELVEQTWSEGDWGGVFPGGLLAGAPGVSVRDTGTLLTQTLDVAGSPVGTLGVLHAGPPGDAETTAKRLRALDVVAEELDTVLMLVHTASEKHQLILQCNEHLANPVFEAGMDQAVRTLAQRVRLPGFLLLYRDAVQPQVLHYRTYRHGQLEYESGEQPGLRWRRCCTSTARGSCTGTRACSSACSTGAPRRRCSSPRRRAASPWARSSSGATRASPRTRWTSSACWPPR